jgi:hypothetical protein
MHSGHDIQLPCRRWKKLVRGNTMSCFKLFLLYLLCVCVSVQILHRGTAGYVSVQIESRLYGLPPVLQGAVRNKELSSINVFASALV